MNELRLILLGIGLLFIAGIYFWGSYKSRQQIRSRVEKFPSGVNEYTDKIEITPKEDLDEKDMEALSEFKDIINDSRQEHDDESLSLTGDDQEDEREQEQEEVHEEKKARPDDAEQELIVFYIMAEKNKHFTGPEILAATEEVGMRYGSMDIFHFYESGEVVSKKALFSLINIVEPGLFDLKQLEHFSTHGLAIFMQVFPDDNSEHIFDMMLDTAWKLVEKLGGELHDEQHNVVDPLIVSAIREKLYS